MKKRKEKRDRDGRQVVCLVCKMEPDNRKVTKEIFKKVDK